MLEIRGTEAQSRNIVFGLPSSEFFCVTALQGQAKMGQLMRMLWQPGAALISLLGKTKDAN